MMYFTNEARQSAVDNIASVVRKLATTPATDHLTLQDIENAIHYLGEMKEELNREIKNASKPPVNNVRNGIDKQTLSIIENEVNRLIDRVESREERTEKALAAGNSALVEVYERNDVRDLYKLSGIDFCLDYIGYHRTHDANTGKQHIKKSGD